MSPKGYRGYVFSRPVNGHRVPQHIQNLVIRDYAARKRLLYKLSATEYVMPGSYLVLEQVLAAISGLDGILLYTMYMLPSDAAYRHSIYERILGAGCGLHAAVEDFTLETSADVPRWESVLLTADICATLNYDEIERWLA